MPVNDFEKQVQQKMDELQFAPSATVWQGVERQIAPRKKRRLIFWLLLLTALGGGAAWWYSMQQAGNPAAGAIVTNQPPSATDTKPGTTLHSKTASGGTTEIDAGTEKRKPATASNSFDKKLHDPLYVEPAPGARKEDWLAKNNEGGKTSNLPLAVAAARKLTTKHQKGTRALGNKYNDDAAVPASLPLPASKIASAAQGRQQRQHTMQNSGLPQHRSANAETPTKASVLAPDALTTDDTDNPMEVMHSLSPFTSNDLLPLANNSIHTADLFAVTSIGEPQIAASAKADSLLASNKNTSKPRKKGFSWGIAVQGGVSNISQGLTSAFKSMPSYDVASNYQSASAPGTGTNNGSVAASPVTRGTGYAAGIFITQPLTRRLGLSLGINYRFSSTHMQVNRQPDPSLAGNTLFTAGSSSSYTNKFHFLEWPLTLQQGLGRAGRWNVNAGLTLSFLTANYTLLYDAAAKRYTSGDDAINKMQVGFTAGFEYRLLKRRTRLALGPQFNYGFSNMFNSNVYGNRHPLFVGLRAAVYFSKK